MSATWLSRTCAAVLRATFILQISLSVASSAPSVPDLPIIKVHGAFVSKSDIICPHEIILSTNDKIDLMWNKISSDQIAAVCLSKVATALGPTEMVNWLTDAGFDAYNLGKNESRSFPDFIYARMTFKIHPHPYRHNINFYSVRFAHITDMTLNITWRNDQLFLLSLSCGHYFTK